MHRALTRRFALPVTALALALATALVMITDVAASRAIAPRRKTADAKPTVVLVNGAWANTASWSDVIARLQAAGYTVDAPPNPLRSLTGDAATISDFLRTIKGPVVLVGHSYGGAVITNAARGDPNVKALVYVDAFAPAKGESALGLDATMPGSALGAGPMNVFNFVPYPGAPKGDALLYVKPAVFEQAFANGLPAREGAVLAATQAPAAYSALTAPSGSPAWKTIPSWYVLGTIDRAIPRAIQLFMATRMHAHITTVHAGHLSMIADPSAVARVITEAARAAG